jgi:hypothetical protein
VNVRHVVPALVAVSGVFAVVSGCGSRTGIEYKEGPPPVVIPECTQNQDCDGFDNLCAPVECSMGTCQTRTPVNCDDGDPCTTDSCDPATGKCAPPSPATLDLDGDHHRAPLPGMSPNDPNSCGDDCDDTNAAAFPGGIEICDGVDNDCNGVVDDGAALVSAGDTVKISEGTEGHPSSLAYSGGDGYMSAYDEEVSSTVSIYLAALSESGSPKPANKFTVGPADAYGGGLAWTGDRFGIAWTDRRDARGNVLNYEVYFNLVNPDGTKMKPDLRVTHADGFSIGESLVWTGSEFALVWEDDGMNKFGRNEIFGQRIDLNGGLIGGNIKLVDDGGNGQISPSIAPGQRSLGVVWLRGDAAMHELMFAPFDHQLHPLAAPVTLSGKMSTGVYPVIVYNQAEYVIAWYDPDSPLKTVYGTVRGELGEELVAAKPITQSPRHARYPTLVPYGDRSLLVWSDDRDNNFGYELYAKTLDRKLNTLTPETRITNAIGNSIDPIAAFGPKGQVGVLFDDNRDGSWQVYFTHLNCITGAKQ